MTSCKVHLALEGLAYLDADLCIHLNASGSEAYLLIKAMAKKSEPASLFGDTEVLEPYASSPVWIENAAEKEIKVVKEDGLDVGDPRRIEKDTEAVKEDVKIAIWYLQVVAILYVLMEEVDPIKASKEKIGIAIVLAQTINIAFIVTKAIHLVRTN